ncbi:MAG: Holliday junction resolvase RuvX [Clostridia bacterium]|nr:Holliday junction resolvase RuvX [Clostridia bacterium]MBR4452231.1 Holliday junction resolvase RuvX [Clostridia bacterium]
MIIMSVDYGDVRTGIAVCDKLEILASPVCTVKEWNQDKLIDRIIELASSHKVELFVVGLPKNMDSTLGSRAEKCMEFAAALSEKSGIPYEMRDERLTTVSAATALNDTNVRGAKRKDSIDQVSAVLILQDYLDSKKLKA